MAMGRHGYGHGRCDGMVGDDALQPRLVIRHGASGALGWACLAVGSIRTYYVRSIRIEDGDECGGVRMKS